MLRAFKWTHLERSKARVVQILRVRVVTVFIVQKPYDGRLSILCVLQQLLKICQGSFFIVFVLLLLFSSTKVVNWRKEGDGDCD